MQDAPAPSRSDGTADAGDAEGIPVSRRTDTRAEVVAEDEIADAWAEVYIDVAEKIWDGNGERDRRGEAG